MDSLLCSSEALVWLGPERLEVQEQPDPVAQPGEVVITVEAAGICGSEIEGYLGRQANRTPPLVMGHEFAGVVSAIGVGVTWAEYNNFVAKAYYAHKLGNAVATSAPDEKGRLWVQLVKYF